nr:MAG TPA: minor tail protein [Caudoviricetes sp.]
MQGIEFQIINDSDEATNSIEQLGKALAELKINVKGGISAVSRAGSAISKLRTALDGIDTSGIANKLKGVSDAVNQLNISPNAKISSSLPKNITALNAAVANIQPEKIVQLGSALQAVANSSGAKISATLPKNITALNTALAGLDAGGIAKLSGLADGLRPLGELERAKLTSFTNQLSKLPAVIQELDKVDLDKFTRQMKDLAEAMKPFADEMNKVSSGFSAFPTRIQRLITSTEQYNGTVRRATTSTNAWNSAIKAISFVTIYRAAAKLLSAAIAKSSQYTEDLNLFTVSMGKYAEEAYNYAQKVSEIVGIDPAEWMRNQGVFNTIITGFGVAGDKAAYMSKNLTQLGYDIASFYNLDFESAMQKVQSGIAGELEPLRRLGYDLSVARLEQERLNLGIDKSVSSMTQAEKSQLRYYAMMTQVTQVQGDMARTLEQPANMLRVLKAQFEQCARAIGNLFIPILVKVLPFAIAVANALREIIAAIAGLFGVTLQAPDWGDSFGGATAGSGAIADNMDSAAGSAKELKKYIAGFDELNVLPDQNQGGGSGGSAGGGGGDLGIELPGYDFLKNAVGNKIDEWKKKLEPLVNFVKDNLKEILELVATIGTALLAWRLATELMTGISALKALSQNGLSIPLTITAGAILAATGFKIEFSGIKDAIEKKLNGFNFSEIILGGLVGTAGTGLLGKGIGQFIAKAFSESTIAKAITAGGGTISTGLIGTAIGGIVAGIPMFVTGVYDAIMNGLNILNGLLIPAGSTLAGAGIGAIIGSLVGPIGTGIGAIIGLVVGGLTDLGILIYQKWDEISAFFAPVAEWFDVNVVQPISGFFSGLWTDIVDTFSPAVTWFSDLWKSVSQTFEDVFYDIGVLASGTWETIKIIWGIVSDWFDTNVIQPVASFFSGLWDGISSWAIKSWNKISTVFSGIAAWFDANVIRPIVGFFTDLWTDITVIFGKVVGFFKGIINGVLSGLNSAISYAFGGINSILRSIRGFSIAGFTPFSGLREISVPQIPMLADGGFVDQGQLFIAREAGAEMVGSIGRRTAVANNDQIVEGITNGVREGNDDVVNALYAVAQQIIMEMREQGRNDGGGNYDFDRAVADAQRRNARMYG